MVKRGDKKITISITAGTVIKTIFIFAAFYFVYQFLDLVLVILTAVVIASAIEPATKWFARYKIPRIPAVVIIYISIIAAFAGIVYTFVPLVVDEVIEIDRHYDLSYVLSQYVGTETTNIESVAKTSFSFRGLLGKVRESFSGTPEETLQTISVIFGGILSLVLIIVFSFYLAVQKDGVSDFLRIITPNKHEEYIIGLWRRTRLKIGLWMQGQLMLGLIVGVLVYLGMSLMQVPHPLVLALLAALFEIIPIFGPVLAAIPAIIFAYPVEVLLFGPGLGSAIAIAVFYVIIQQFENHLIYPLVVRKVVGVPPLLVIIAVIIGAKSAGFLGIILAVPVAAVLMEFANDIQKEKDLAKMTS